MDVSIPNDNELIASPPKDERHGETLQNNDQVLFLGIIRNETKIPTVGSTDPASLLNLLQSGLVRPRFIDKLLFLRSRLNLSAHLLHL